MNIIIPCDWKTVNLLTEENANNFGEALRGLCFIGNCEQTGCYSTFQLIPELKVIKSGKIYEEAKKIIQPELEETLHVYYSQLKERDCWLPYKGIENKIKIRQPYVLVCAWEWGGDGTLYFRFNNRTVIHYDCKNNYEWKWINKGV